MLLHGSVSVPSLHSPDPLCPPSPYPKCQLLCLLFPDDGDTYCLPSPKSLSLCTSGQFANCFVHISLASWLQMKVEIRFQTFPEKQVMSHCPHLSESKWINGQLLLSKGTDLVRYHSDPASTVVMLLWRILSWAPGWLCAGEHDFIAFPKTNWWFSCEKWFVTKNSSILQICRGRKSAWRFEMESCSVLYWNQWSPVIWVGIISHKLDRLLGRTPTQLGLCREYKKLDPLVWHRLLPGSMAWFLENEVLPESFRFLLLFYILWFLFPLL